MTECPNNESASLIHSDAIEALEGLEPGRISLVVSSPPYNVGKSYERDKQTVEEYLKYHERLIRRVFEILSPEGSVCWQVGNYVSGNVLLPLDVPFIQMFNETGFRLRNRIIWRFNFGLNSSKRFSGRYQTLLWFTKGDNYTFNLDPVRIPQLYPGKRHAAHKSKAGQPSGNPLGKNPSDYWEFSAHTEFVENSVWDFPNVKALHPEKTEHPCQFPVELVERCVLALSNRGDTVLDPFLGSGTTALAALRHDRRAIGIDKEFQYLAIARNRLRQLAQGTLPIRPLGRKTREPSGNEKVARIPQEWVERDILTGGVGGQAQEEEGKGKALTNGEGRSATQARP